MLCYMFISLRLGSLRFVVLLLNFGFFFDVRTVSLLSRLSLCVSETCRLYLFFVKFSIQVSEILKEKRPLWSIPDLELLTTDLVLTDFV